jgi:hypothetical protein
VPPVEGVDASDPLGAEAQPRPVALQEWTAEAAAREEAGQVARGGGEPD